MLRRMYLPYQKHRQLLFYTVLIFLFVFMITLNKRVKEEKPEKIISESEINDNDNGSYKEDSTRRGSTEIESTPFYVDNVGEIDSNITWDTGGPQHVSWPKDDTCKEHVTRFSVRHGLETRALVSYPGSGNTWIRKKAITFDKFICLVFNCLIDG